MNTSALAATLMRVTLNVLYAPMKLLPARRKVVMLSREHDSVPDDFARLADAIRRADPTIEVVILARRLRPGIRAMISYSVHLLTQLYHVATARLLVIDTYSITASALNHKRALTVIQIWHALGAFKKFGLSILGKGEGRDARLAKAARMHQNYDLVLVSGEPCRTPYAEAFGVDPDKIAVAPLPRVDALLDERRNAGIRERFFKAHPELSDQRIALFAPTFRTSGAAETGAEELAAALGTVGYTMIATLHPLSAQSVSPAVVTTPEFSTQELLAVADVFITDYSSALFEAALTGLPCYFFAPDLDDYLRDRAFYFDYPRDLPGPVSASATELASLVAAAAASSAATREFAAHWVQGPAAGNEPHTAAADHMAGLLLGRL